MRVKLIRKDSGIHLSEGQQMNQYSKKMKTSKEARTTRREKQVTLHEDKEIFTKRLLRRNKRLIT